MSFFSARTRRALIIGCNYPGTQSALEGCAPDALNIYKILKERGFKSSEIRVLTDVPEIFPQRSRPPTKNNIFRGMRWLSDCPSNCNVFMSFSGHGTQVADANGDEADGMDECILAAAPGGGEPGMSCVVTDDEINNRLVSCLPASSKAFLFFDSCHSGSVSDISYKVASSASDKQALVTCISGCMDEGVSLETDTGSGSSGVLTSSFLKVLRDAQPYETIDPIFNRIVEEVKINSYQRPVLSVSSDICKSIRIHEMF